MAKKITNTSPSKKAVAGKPTISAIRNSAIPKVVAAASPVPARREITQGDIAKRAYEIWLSGTGGSEHDNWSRAERELRGA